MTRTCGRFQHIEPRSLFGMASTGSIGADSDVICVRLRKAIRADIIRKNELRHRFQAPAPVAFPCAVLPLAEQGC